MKAFLLNQTTLLSSCCQAYFHNREEVDNFFSGVKNHSSKSNLHECCGVYSNYAGLLLVLAHCRINIWKSSCLCWLNELLEEITYKSFSQRKFRGKKSHFKNQLAFCKLVFLMYRHIYTSVYMHIYIHVCLYIHTNTWRSHS